MTGLGMTGGVVVICRLREGRGSSFGDVIHLVGNRPSVSDLRRIIEERINAMVQFIMLRPRVPYSYSYSPECVEGSSVLKNKLVSGARGPHRG
jgi:hypothetical protein